jgi:hypothetical protein
MCPITCIVFVIKSLNFLVPHEIRKCSGSMTHGASGTIGAYRTLGAYGTYRTSGAHGTLGTIIAQTTIVSRKIRK